MKLDRSDRHILSALQAHGGLSNLELAEQVNLSPSSCLRRVKALTDAGIIVDKITRFNAEKLGLGLRAVILIGMDRHTPDRFEKFETAVASYPEVQSCALITGHNADYMLQVIVPDMAAYQALLLDRITHIPGVTDVHSSFVMRQVLDRHSLPLSYLD